MHSHFTDEQVREARERFAAGVTALALARELGTLPHVIRAWTRGRKRIAAGGPITLHRVASSRRRVDRDVVRQLHGQGLPARLIGQTVGCARGTVNRILRDVLL